jgi:IMP dehydrogenase
MPEDTLTIGLTFDDVLLMPRYASVIPKDIDVSTRLTPSIPLKIPLLSAAMDTVTESQTAISMAREGGIGIIHKNLSIAAQALEVDKVKKSESGIVADPVTMHPDQRLFEALEIMAQYHISGVPVVQDGKLVGILTSSDFIRLSLELMDALEASETATPEDLEP